VPHTRVTPDFNRMNINTNSSWKMAERHYREHLMNKPNDDEESAMRALTITLTRELGSGIAQTVLSDPLLPARVEAWRETFYEALCL